MHVSWDVLYKCDRKYNHYGDVIMGSIAPQITSLTIVYSTVYSDADQKKIKALRHWPLCGEFTGTGEFPAQMASNAENVSIWWRHHVLKLMWLMTIPIECSLRLQCVGIGLGIGTDLDMLTRTGRYLIICSDVFGAGENKLEEFLWRKG